MEHVRLLAPLPFMLFAATPVQACQSFPTIFFERGTAQIGEDGMSALADFARQAVSLSEQVSAIRIIGHSDRTGSVAVRKRIALARAEGVRDVLLAFGIPPRLIAIDGAADGAPLLATDEGVSEARNRRAELQLTWTPEAPAAAIARREAALRAGEAIPLC